MHNFPVGETRPNEVQSGGHRPVAALRAGVATRLPKIEMRSYRLNFKPYQATFVI